MISKLCLGKSSLGKESPTIFSVVERKEEKKRKGRRHTLLFARTIMEKRANKEKTYEKLIFRPNFSTNDSQ